MRQNCDELDGQHRVALAGDLPINFEAPVSLPR